jgi:hypothetical protein
VVTSNKKKEVIATYDQDSKRYHRFLIDVGQFVTGVIYVKKGDKIPDSFTVNLKTKQGNPGPEDY